MKLTIIGATGFVGSELVKEVLKNFNQIDEICCFYHSNKRKNKLIGMLNDLLLSNITTQMSIKAKQNSPCGLFNFVIYFRRIPTPRQLFLKRQSLRHFGL